MRFVLAAILVLGVCATAFSDATIQTFDKAGEGTPYAVGQHGAKPEATVVNGSLALLEGSRSRGAVRNSTAFERTAEGTHAEVEVRFTFAISKGGRGAGMVLLPTERFGKSGGAPDLANWDEPNLPGALSLGIDTHNPPTRHWFDERGNVHDRPQREISLHWDGEEIANVRTETEFRDDAPHRLRLLVRYVEAGAEVTLELDDETLFEDRFFARVAPYESRLAIGAGFVDTTGDFRLDDVRVDWRRPTAKADLQPAPTVVRTFDKAIFNAKNRVRTATFELVPETFRARRVVASLSLAAGPGGWDPWDRGAAIYVWRGEGETAERIELIRFITPFRRQWTWHVDLTDYQALLRGARKMEMRVESWQKPDDPPKGFAITLDLSYWEGTPEREVIRIENLWNLSYEFGNTEEAIAKVFPLRTSMIDAETKSAKVKITVTGHRQGGEFTAADRTLTVNGTTTANRLWKTDVYLNPCRPQGGTWKFDRAGWAPGSIVDAWEVDVTKMIVAGEEATLVYRPVPFEVPEGVKFEASHTVAAQLILYR